MTSRRVCFTINNPTIEEIVLLDVHLDSDLVTYAVYGHELSSTGTPHLQGFAIYSAPTRLRSLSRDHFQRAHLEPARGTSQQARDYCKKDGDFREFGVFPDGGGRRNDLAAIIEWADEFQSRTGAAARSPDVAIAQPVAYIRYPRLVRALFHRQPAVEFDRGERRRWQHELEHALTNVEPDDRTVKFYVDEEGAKGKSWFCRYMLATYPQRVQLLGVGRVADITYAIDITKSIFLFNIPRQTMEHLQYRVLEMLKDRVIFVTKYQSETRIIRHKVHVVVFSNEYPDMNKMSVDRYDVVNNLE